MATSAHRNFAPIPELDLFQLPSIQNSVVSGRNRSFHPIAALAKGALIEFNIETTKDEYLKLFSSYLYLRVQLTLTTPQGTQAAHDAWDKVAIVNNCLHSLFERIDIYIDDIIITGNTSHYAYSAFFQTLFNYTEVAKKTTLTAPGYFQIAPSNLNNPIEAVSKYFKPVNNSTKSNEVEFCGRLHLPLFSQPLSMIGGVRLRLLLHPALQQFSLICPETHRLSLEILKAEFICYTETVSPQIVEAHNEALKISSARYPLLRTDVISHNLPSGGLSASLTTFIRGQIPRRLFIALVSDKAFNGDFTLTPFYFKNYDVSHIAVYVNSQLVNHVPNTPNFEKEQYLREYIDFCNIVCEDPYDSNVPMTRKYFKDGCTIFAYNLTADQCAGLDSDGHIEEIKFGVVRVELAFAKPLPEVIHVVGICEYDSLLEINGDRQAIVNL